MVGRFRAGYQIEYSFCPFQGMSSISALCSQWHFALDLINLVSSLGFPALRMIRIPLTQGTRTRTTSRFCSAVFQRWQRSQSFLQMVSRELIWSSSGRYFQNSPELVGHAQQVWATYISIITPLFPHSPTNKVFFWAILNAKSSSESSIQAILSWALGLFWAEDEEEETTGQFNTWTCIG